jgi:uncharacterized protein YndB with AHSA1/START domain
VTRITTAIDMAASPREVFPWLIEPDLLARWIGGFVSSEALTDGPTRAGSRSRDVLEEKGRRLVIETEVTEFVADRRLSVHIRWDTGESDDRYDLQPVGTGTRLTYVSDTRLRGPMRLLSRAISPQLRARAERDLACLRDLVEAGRGAEATPGARPGAGLADT